ncbi:MAG TPA: site-specific integrase [Actinophytocola sp.]|uniref:tyrosine-type recombinase/integrase n=1 Tax=Actinophytocola sp. TaxID=1872138 RepID=UPI002DB6545F|nr:site-specific integrase [Actinophytocola sp.]HEU5475817.1 site-specific integrase [Actinophytocola sp.]
MVNARGKPVLERTELYGTGHRYKVRYIDPDGREKSKTFPDRQKKQAEDFLISVENDKREGRYIDPRAARVKFRTQADNWIKGQSDDPASREVLRSRLRSKILPHLGDLPIGKITPSTIRDWLGEIEDQADNYKVVLFSVVTGVMDSAIDDKLIRDNPCKAKTIRRPTSPAVEVKDIWPEARVKAIRDGMAERWRIAIPIGAGLGLRQGEIFGLSPEDIDESALLLHVRRQLRTVERTLVFALPKGNKTRTVPLSPGVLAEIKDHLEAYPPCSVTLPWRKPAGDPVTVRLVATGVDGRLYSGDLFTKTVWERAFRTAGIERTKQIDGMHALRHFYASTLLAQGVSIKELATYLGHSDPGFTLRVYTHLVPSSHQRARVAVDTVFGRPGSGDGLETA